MIAIQDPDFTLYVGEVREQLAALPTGSVDCVVTSPPYWGLRDYGTAEWEGGDPGCDHRHDTKHQKQGATSARAGRSNVEQQRNENFVSACAKCGAVRVDRQIGLEATPAEYVESLVGVFREIRRVLVDHGTVWLNLGDTYVSTAPGTRGDALRQEGILAGVSDRRAEASRKIRPATPTGLKPKDLVGIPWRVAFGLQDDGWYLRADIIWSKPNPMPESVRDRPTKAHEYLFLLSKQPRYFFDQEAVREPHKHDGRKVTTVVGGDGSIQHRDGERWPGSGRNIRSVWDIATRPYAGAHFATFPEEIPRRAIRAGCPAKVCRTCGEPRQRIVERERVDSRPGISVKLREITGGNAADTGRGGDYVSTTTGWTDCGHDDYRHGVVLDPFMGSGTTALVARKQGRHSIGIELNPDYAALIGQRLAQQTLLFP